MNFSVKLLNEYFVDEIFLRDIDSVNLEVTGRIFNEMLDSAVFYSISKCLIIDSHDESSARSEVEQFIAANMDCSNSSRHSLANIAMFFISVALVSQRAVQEYLQSNLDNRLDRLLDFQLYGLNLITVNTTILSAFDWMCCDLPAVDKVKCTVARQPSLAPASLSARLHQEISEYLQASAHEVGDCLVDGIEKKITGQIANQITKNYLEKKSFLLEQCSTLFQSITLDKKANLVSSENLRVSDQYQ